MSLRLFVDDIREAPEGWHCARTVTEAIRILDERDVSDVSLDHDISHAVGLDSVMRPYPCGETFEPVARFIALMYAEGEKFPGTVTIHTANPAGAERMRQILAHCQGIDVAVELGRPCNRLEKGDGA